MKSLKKSIKNSGVSLVSWILLSVILFTGFLFYLYGDIKVTTTDSLALIDCTIKGQFFSFYKINPCAYDIIIYILLAVWNIPLWIASRLFEVDLFSSLMAIMWAKLAIIPYVVAACILLKKICLLIGIDRKDAIKSIFVFLTSIFFMSGVIMQNGVDIISVCFTLYGIILYLDEKQKRWRWVLVFAIAVTFKMFAFMIFIPLLLLREKRIFKILKSIVGVVSITAVSRILFKVLSNGGIEKGSAIMNVESNNVTDVAATTVAQTSQGVGVFQGGFMNAYYIFAGNIDLFIENISLWVIAMTILCVFCYLKNVSREDLGIWTIYLSFLSYLVFFICSWTHPFWLILIIPYISILIVYKRENRNVTLLFESIGALALIMQQNINFYWCFGSIKNLTSLMCPKLFGQIKEEYWDLNLVNFVLGKYIGEGGFDKLERLVGGVFVGVYLILAYMFYPSKKDKTIQFDNELNFNEIVIFRIVASAMLFIMPILFYIYIQHSFS